MKVGCVAAPTNRSVPAKQASKMLYLLCNLVLVLTAIITSAFIRIVTGKLRMFRIQVAVMAKTTFSTWYSCFQTISFMGHITAKEPALDTVVFMASFSNLSFQSQNEFVFCIKYIPKKFKAWETD